MFCQRGQHFISQADIRQIEVYGPLAVSKRLCPPVEDVFGELEATALEGATDRRHVRVAGQEEDLDAVHVLLKETAAPRWKPPSGLDCLRNQTD